MKPKDSSIPEWERFLEEDDKRQKVAEKQEAGLLVGMETAQELTAPVEAGQNEALLFGSDQFSKKMARAFASLTEDQQQIVLKKYMKCRDDRLSSRAIVTEICLLIEGLVRFNELGAKAPKKPVPAETAKLREEIAQYLKGLDTPGFINRLEALSKSPSHPKQRIM